VSCGTGKAVAVICTGLRKGWIELWTGQDETPPESDDAPHSASIGQRAPTIRASIEHKQPVSCSNRNMNWAGMSTIRAPSHILRRLRVVAI
jgi:hypothetical protein